MAQGALGGLVISLAGNSTSFTSAMEQAEVAAAKTAKAVTARFEELNSSIERRIVGIGSALVAGFSVAAFAGQIKAVAEFRAKLDDLADSGLGTVEALSKLQQAAKLSGGNFDEITSGLQKMVRGLAGSEKETSQAGEALRRLGISARDTAGNLRDPADVMQDVAKRFAGYKDGADKAAFAQAIFGRGGAALLPILKDMAEYGDLHAKVTAKQAAEAESFNKALTRMQIALEGSSKKIAGDMIPVGTALFQVVTDIITGVKGVTTEAEKLARSKAVEEWAVAGVGAFTSLLNIGDVLYRQLQYVRENINLAITNLEALGKVGSAVFNALNNSPLERTDFVIAKLKNALGVIAEQRGVIASNVEVWKQQIDAISKAELIGDRINAGLKRQLALNKEIYERQVLQDFRRSEAISAGGSSFRGLDSSGLATNTATAQLSEYEKAVNHLTERQALLTAELANGNVKLTETEKYLAKLAENVELSWEEYDKLVEVLGRTTVAQEKELALRERVKKAYEEANAALAEEQKALDEANGKANEHYNSMIRGLADQADAIDKEVASYGLLDSQKQRNLITDLETQLNLEKEGLARTEIINKLEGEIFTRQRLMAAMANKEGHDASIKALQEQQRAFEDFARNLADVGTDAFMRLWDGGRDGFRSLLDDLWKWFKQFVARMLAEKIIVPVTLSALGISAPASAASSALSGGLSLGGLAGNFAGGFSSTVASFFTNFQGNIQAGFQSIAAGNFAGAAGTLAPYVLAAGALVSLIAAFKDKGENWKARLGYGSNANAYATDTTFGRVGFDYIAGSDALNREIQKFFESFKGFDERILKTLSSGQETAIRAAVASLSSTREFAFPKGDETAAQQLTLQAISEYYGAVFSEIDAHFSEVIKNWQGTVEDLLKTIDMMVGALELVSSGTIKGLTIPIIEEWQRENETLAQTIQRVITNYAQFIDKFGDDSTKIALLTKPFTDAMADLGVTLPTTRKGFFDYVQALDLADESQRAIYEAIMNNVGAADAYYQALERTAQAQQQAADTVAQALESLMTPSERLAAAQALLASHNITSRETLIAYINSLDASTEAGRAAIAMLGGVLKAFDLISAANPDLDGLSRSTHIVGGEAVRTAEAIDQASEALDNLAAAADTFRAYVDTAIGQQQTLLSRYGSTSTLEDMQRAVDGIRQQFEAAGIAAPATTSAIAAMAAGLDATTPRGIALLGMLTQLAEAMDALQAATDAAAKAAEEAAKAAADALAQQWEAIRAEEEARRAERDAIASFFDRIKTDSEKLADATALLKGFGLLGIDTLDGFRTALQGLITQGLIGSDMLDKLYDAWQRANQRGAEVGSGPGGEQLDTAARASALTAFFDSLQSAAERLASARQLLLGAGIDARYTTLDGLRSRLRELADQGATVDSLKAIADAFDAVQVAAAQAATDVAAGTAERAKYIADIQAIWSSLTSGAERLAASTALLTSRGLGAGTTATQLQDWITQMARVGMAAADVQAIVDAWQMVTAAAQEASDAAARAAEEAARAAEEAVRAAAERARAISSVFDSLLTESEKLGRANNILNQYGIRAGAGLDDVRVVLQQLADSGGTVEEMQTIADAWGTVSAAAQQAADAAAQAMVDAAGKLADEIKQALANVARAAEFRQGIGDTIARLLASRPGANYGAYLTGNVSTARNLFAGAQGFDAQLNAAGRLQTALQTRYEYEMQALTAARDAQIQAQQQAVQAAQQLGQAFKGLGDYARSLLTGDLSPLSAEDKLAAAAQQYRDLLAKAQGGDSSAASSLQGAAQSYLQLAGDYFARNNPAYIAAFNDVQGNLAALGSRGDAQLQYAASAAASLSAMANTLTPQMIALQDQYVTDLGDLSDAVGDAQELQQQAAENAAMAYAEIAASNAEVAANTANLPQDVRELIAEMIASRETTAALLQTIAANTGSAATASASIAASSEAAVFLSGTAIGAPTL